MTVLLFLVGVLAIAVGIGASIALHEIGHLVPAKRFGVKCTQYMIGFGPTVWSSRRGETEYGIKAIPLGGYVRMVGMFPPRNEKAAARAGGRTEKPGRLGTLIEDARTDSLAEITPGEEHRAFYRLSTPKKITIMLGGPLMNLFLAVLIFSGLVLLHGVAVQQPGAQATVVSQCVRPVDGTTGADESPCTAQDPTAPAAAAGLRPGDEFVSIGGRPVGEPGDVSGLIRPHAGQALPVVVRRDGQEVTLQITPIANTVPQYDAAGELVRDETGRVVTTTAGFIGVSTGSPIEVSHSPAQIPSMVWEVTSRTAGVVLTLPQRLVDVAEAAFGPGERDPDGPISVVGVGRVAGEVSSGTWQDRDGNVVALTPSEQIVTLWSILGSLNIALFVFNLVPLLPLDGGHIAGATWEGIKRGVARLTNRPDPGYVDVAKALPVAYVMTVVLLGMSALLIYADLVKPVRL